MRRVAVLVLSAAVLAGAGCSRSSTPAGQAVVEVERGSRVLVGERGDGLLAVEGRRTVHVGAQVKVLSGSATIALEDGARLDARTGSEVDLGSPVSLVADDLLVTSGSHPLTIAVAGSQVAVDGVARLTRDLAVSAATYRGTVTMRSAARSLAVPALRQAEIPSLGVLPAEPRALAYDKNDAWDRRFLGVAIELSDQLDSLSKGFTNSLDSREGRTPGFYRILIPALEHEPEFGDQLLAVSHNPGDSLIGATIAVSGKLGSFAQRWVGEFAFKNQGATWGLVALDQQVNDTDALLHTVDSAVGAQSFAFAPAPTVTVVSKPVPAPAPAVPAPAPAVPAPVPPKAPTATTIPTAPAPSPGLVITLPTLPELIPPPDPNNPGILAPLLNTVTATLGGLLSGK